MCARVNFIYQIKSRDERGHMIKITTNYIKPRENIENFERRRKRIFYFSICSININEYILMKYKPLLVFPKSFIL